MPTGLWKCKITQAGRRRRHKSPSVLDAHHSIPCPRLEDQIDAENGPSDEDGEKDAKRQRSEPTTPISTSSRLPYEYDLFMGITHVGSGETEGFEDDAAEDPNVLESEENMRDAGNKVEVTSDEPSKGDTQVNAANPTTPKPKPKAQPKASPPATPAKVEGKPPGVKKDGKGGGKGKRGKSEPRVEKRKQQCTSIEGHATSTGITAWDSGSAITAGTRSRVASALELSCAVVDRDLGWTTFLRNRA